MQKPDPAVPYREDEIGGPTKTRRTAPRTGLLALDCSASPSRLLGQWFSMQKSASITAARPRRNQGRLPFHRLPFAGGSPEPPAGISAARGERTVRPRHRLSTRWGRPVSRVARRESRCRGWFRAGRLHPARTVHPGRSGTDLKPDRGPRHRLGLHRLPKSPVRFFPFPSRALSCVFVDNSRRLW